MKRQKDQETGQEARRIADFNQVDSEDDKKKATPESVAAAAGGGRGATIDRVFALYVHDLGRFC